MEPLFVFPDLLYATYGITKLAGEEVTEIVLKLVGPVAVRYLLPATDRTTVRYYQYRT